jgi:hypothetical protein
MLSHSVGFEKVQTGLQLLLSMQDVTCSVCSLLVMSMAVVAMSEVCHAMQCSHDSCVVIYVGSKAQTSCHSNCRTVRLQCTARMYVCMYVCMGVGVL